MKSIAIIIFHLLRSRLCNLLKIIARFSCSSLQKSWTKEFKQMLEGLLDESNAQVKEVRELSSPLYAIKRTITK